MSYILDALRKSEQQRQRGKIPGLSGGSEPPPPRRSGKVFWIVALLLLGNAALFAWWMLEKPSGQESQERSPAAATGSTVAVQQPIVAPALPVPVPQASGPVSGTMPAAAPSAMTPAVAVQEQPPSVPAVDPEVREEESGAAVRPDHSEVPPPSVAAEAPRSPETEIEEPSQARPRYTLGLLPENRKAPTVDVTLHFYTAEPGRRMVRVNSRLLKEGEWLDDRWQLQEISEDGLVLAGPDFDLFIERP